MSGMSVLVCAGGVVLLLLWSAAGWQPSLIVVGRPPTTSSWVMVTGGRPPLTGTKTLAVDYGTLRVGVAMSMGIAPRPVALLRNKGNDTALVKAIIAEAKVEDVRNFIVGLPLERNGTEGPMCEVARNFTQALANDVAVNIPSGRVSLWDERFTSAEAKARMDPHGGALQGSRSIVVDSLAAVAMLEHYFEEQGEGAELVPADEGLEYRPRPRPPPGPSQEELRRRYEEEGGARPPHRRRKPRYC